MKEFAFIVIVSVAVFFLTMSVLRNRCDKAFRAHPAYGNILELIDWDWMPATDLFMKGEAKYGKRWPSDANAYRFLSILEEDGKIEKREESVAVSGGKVRRILIRKLPAPGKEPKTEA